jgi:site-specific DNA recombinase
MKKAVLYARVSSAMQEKERTIESQVAELKKQIASSGDVLIKEYVDDGYSGAQLDRPALDQLRRDLRTVLFDTVYFLNTDRIAREVTYQTIIIAEILKYKKQIIINGQDYVHNPENKFSLTVLGAVAELERAKIIERLTRGKLHKLRQGYLVSHGHNLYGYDYIRKTDSNPVAYVINKKEAIVVRKAFEMYAGGNIGVNRICQYLEKIKAPRKTGRKPWHITQIKYMLKNESYTGIKYFNTEHYVREQANPLHGIHHSTGHVVKRPREDWIGVKIPQIIPKSLFDKVKARFEWNKKHYRNPRQVQLLSNLVSCGSCGYFCFAYQRYYKDRRRKKDPEKVFHKIAYKCSKNAQHVMHSNPQDRCRNPEVASHLLESCIFNMIKDTMTDPIKLKQCLEHAKEKARTTRFRMEKQLKEVDENIKDLGRQKKRILDLYAMGGLDRNNYVQKCLWYDNEANKVRAVREELIKKIPILHKKEVMKVSVQNYCERVKTGLKKCVDFDTRRQFLLDHIERIIYKERHVILHGSVPVRLKAYEDPNQSTTLSKVGFQIESKIVR